MRRRILVKQEAPREARELPRVDARQLLLELQEILKEQAAEAAPDITLSQLAAKFIPVKRRTIASALDFEARLNNHVLRVFGDATWRTLKKRDVQEFLLDLVQKRGLSPQTANHCRDVGRQLIEDAIENEEWPAPNPFAKADKLPLPELDRDTLTRSEAGRLLWCVPLKWRPLFALALYLGPRRKTIYEIRLEDVDFTHALINFNNTKTGRRLKHVPIPRELMPHLKMAAKKSAGIWLFTNRFGGQFQRNSRILNRVLRAAMRKAGIQRAGGELPKVTFRGLRRVCSCLLQESGCSPWVVSKVLGHSQASLVAMGSPKENTTAKFYTSFQPGFVRRELNKLHLRKK